MARLTRSGLGWLLALAVCAAGCRPAPPPPGAAPRERPATTQPSEVELRDPKLTRVAPDRIRFEVSYRFTRGEAGKYYMCELSFPDAKAARFKPMEWWELKPEGVIRDENITGEPLGKRVEFRLTEAESQQDGYKKISNVATGDVPP
ncbi:MAG: hypothetical protein ACRC33_31525 [Gemmataceae bacterium]